jgi:hypothetical protein
MAGCADFAAIYNMIRAIIENIVEKMGMLYIPRLIFT